MEIYLVSGETIVTKILRDYLSDLGHEAVSLSSAHLLLDILEAVPNPPDLIIAELNALIRANSALRKVARLYSDIPIIIMVGHDSVLPVDKAISYGVYAYLQNPLRLAELELLLVQLSKDCTNGQFRAPRRVVTHGRCEEQILTLSRRLKQTAKIDGDSE
jgi:DNA-binding NtrC family response regulator